MDIILASASPRRRILLKQIGLSFEVIPAAFNETVPPGSHPDVLVGELAFQKAHEVACRYGDEKKRALFIGADTIVVRDRRILGKPGDREGAIAMLQSLSGRTHQVYTGVALIIRETDGQIRHHVFHERTDVTFGDLSEAEITAYVNSGSPMDKAGSYGIQDDLGALFVEKIEGDYYNVVGFPLFRFYREVNNLVPGLVTPFEHAENATDHPPQASGSPSQMD